MALESDSTLTRNLRWVTFQYDRKKHIYIFVLRWLAVACSFPEWNSLCCCCCSQKVNSWPSIKHLRKCYKASNNIGVLSRLRCLMNTDSKRTLTHLYPCSWPNVQMALTIRHSGSIKKIYGMGWDVCSRGGWWKASQCEKWTIRLQTKYLNTRYVQTTTTSGEGNRSFLLPSGILRLNEEEDSSERVVWS